MMMYDDLYTKLCDLYDINKVKQFAEKHRQDQADTENDGWLIVFWDDLNFGVSKVGDVVPAVPSVSYPSDRPTSINAHAQRLKSSCPVRFSYHCDCLYLFR